MVLIHVAALACTGEGGVEASLRRAADAVHIDWRYLESAILLESRDAAWPVARIIEHWGLEREQCLLDRTRARRRSYLGAGG